MVSTSPVASSWPSLPPRGSVNIFEPLAAPSQKKKNATSSNAKPSPSNDMDENRGPKPWGNLVDTIEESLRHVSLSCRTNNNNSAHTGASTGAKKKKKKKKK